jgi:hypothetical protein
MVLGELRDVVTELAGGGGDGARAAAGHDLVDGAAVEARIEDAYRRGVGEGRQQAAAEWAGRMREEALLEVSERMEEVRSAEAALISALGREVEGIGLRLCRALARELEPLAARLIARQAIEAIIGELGEVLDGTTQSRVRIEAPPVLLPIVEQAAAGMGGAIEPAGSERLEVTITTDAAVLETRIAEWVKRIGGKP